MTAPTDASRGCERSYERLEPLPLLTCVVLIVGDGARGQQTAQADDRDGTNDRNVTELVGSLSHAITTISAFLDYGRVPYWTIPRACEHNCMRLLSRLAAREPADMNAHYRAYLFTKGLLQAVKNDNMEMVQWLCREYCPTGFVWQAVEDATSLGKTRILEWLATRYEYVLTNPNLMDIAARNGHLETLQWLHLHVPNPPGCSHLAMKQVVHNGHLAVVKWLLEQYPERTHERFLKPLPGIDECNPVPDFVALLAEPFDCSDAFYSAPYSENFELFKWVHDRFVDDSFGFLRPADDYSSLSSRMKHAFHNCGFDKMVRSAITFDTSRGDGEMTAMLWLHERYPERWSANVMDFAAASGNLKAVKWMHANRKEGCTSQAVCGAAENGHLHVIEWLRANHLERSMAHAVNMAAKNGHLHVLKWFHEHEYSGFDGSTMDEAANFGHLDLVKWLHDNRSEGCTQRAMDGAAKNNHLEVVKWLHENRGEGCSTQAMDSAAKKNHLEIVKWLHEHRSEGCTSQAMDKAAASNHLEMVKWLHANRNEGCTTAAMNSASSFDMVKWLHENRAERYTNVMIYGAASNGDFQLVKLVLALVGNSHLRIIGSNPLIHRHFEILQWLHEMDPVQVDLNRIRNRRGSESAMLALLAYMQRTSQIQ